MEFSSLLIPPTLPIAKSLCRTCLIESNKMFTNIQDLVEHEMNKVKLIDILVFLKCVENNDEENWPQGMCESCVSTALVAYGFKLNCLKANATLSQLLAMHSPNIQRTDMDSIDINVVYQDHEYDVPLFSNNTLLDFESTLQSKELAPLPSVSELTASEHPMRKESEKKYTCTLCPRSFTRIYGLRGHMETHTEARHYLCSKCGKGFQTNGGLRQHLLSHTDVGQFKCGFCNKKYKSRQSLRVHFRVAHSGNRHSFACTICNQHFTVKSTLQNHMKSHEGLRQFACPECPKSYTRASYLRLHKLVHSGHERPKRFICTYKTCERKFTTKHSLKAHLAHTHSTERPYKCGVCSKGFATHSGLKSHRELHTATETACTVCSKQLGSKRALQKHLRLHDIEVDPTDMILETVVDDTFFDQAVFNESQFSIQ